MFEWLIPIIVFIAVFLFVISLQQWLRGILLKRHAVAVANADARDTHRTVKAGRLEKQFFKLLPVIAALQQSRLKPAWIKKTEQKISFHPKWQFRSAAEWLAAKELAALGSFITGYALMNDWLWAIITGAGGFFLPELWLKQMLRHRKQSIMKELPNTLDLLSSCTEAGLGFEQAMAVILERKNKGYIYAEFNEMMRQIGMGKSREDALKDLSGRIDEPDFAAFISALVQSEKMGVSVAQTLKTQAAQLRTKHSQHVEKQALEAPVKMLFPLIAFIFPVVFIILFGPIILRFLQGF